MNVICMYQVVFNTIYHIIACNSCRFQYRDSININYFLILELQKMLFLCIYIWYNDKKLIEAKEARV